jgi:TfoX/Sxy family transcriptional regulator of competence genes
MTRLAFNAEHKRVLDAMLLAIDDVRPGRMFGYPGYYVNRNLFACVMGDAVAIKLSEAAVQALLAAKRAEVEPFRPMGRRTMRQWVQIRRKDSEHYRRDEQVLRDSIAFVTAEPAPERTAPRRRHAG